MELCEGCGKMAELKIVGAFKLCIECEDAFYQVQDDLAEMKAKELYGVSYDR